MGGNRRGSCAKGAILVSLVAWTTLLSAQPLTDAGSRSSLQRHYVWKLEDIIEAEDFGQKLLDLDPVVINTSGHQAMYVVSKSLLGLNERWFDIGIADLSTGEHRTVFSSQSVEQIAAIPESDDWSVLMDAGEGVQLYRLDLLGRITPLVVNENAAMFSNYPVNGAVGVRRGDASARLFGVRSHGWSPDGKFLWYSIVSADRPRRGHREPFSWRGNTEWGPHLGQYAPTRIELRVRDGAGRDHLLETADSYVGNPFHRDFLTWLPASSMLEVSTVEYQPSCEDACVVTRHYDAESGSRAATADSALSSVSSSGARLGPSGGVVNISAGEMVERLEDGSRQSFGRAHFELDRTWSNVRKGIAVAAVRYVQGRDRHSIVTLRKDGSVFHLKESDSIDGCDVSRSLDVAVCVRQSVTKPPELIVISIPAGKIRTLVPASKRYTRIAPLRVEPFEQQDPDGSLTTGYVYYPRSYRAGTRYPAIFVTHTRNAANRFVYQPLQWEFPVQVWAELGYVVVTLNEPWSELRQGARIQWVTGEGNLTPAQIRKLIWGAVVSSFESAVDSLARRGLIDPDRVGIAGYSMGAQAANLLMTQSNAFRVASAGDGGYPERSAYFNFAEGVGWYRRIFEGSPYDSDPEVVRNYRRLVPSLRAKLASGPIMQQVVLNGPEQREFYLALKDAGVPTEYFVFPAETHLLHKPLNRAVAMEQNIDWFNFWLLDQEDAAQAKSERYAHWRNMRHRWNQLRVQRGVLSLDSSQNLEGVER